MEDPSKRHDAVLTHRKAFNELGNGIFYTSALHRLGIKPVLVRSYRLAASQLLLLKFIITWDMGFMCIGASGENSQTMSLEVRRRRPVAFGCHRSCRRYCQRKSVPDHFRLAPSTASQATCVVVEGTRRWLCRHFACCSIAYIYQSRGIGPWAVDKHTLITPSKFQLHRWRKITDTRQTLSTLKLKWN